MAETTQPKLRVSREEACQQIEAQIGKGQQLHAQQINSDDELTEARRESRKWSDYNKTLLLKLFDNDSIAEDDYTDFNKVRPVLLTSSGPTPLSDKLRRYQNTMSSSINSLESIRDRLELYDEPSEMLQAISGNEGVSAGRWMWSRERFANNITEIIVKPRSNGSFSLVTKMRPNIGDTLAKKPRSLWYKPEYSTPSGTNTLKTIFNSQRVFDFPKAVPFISDLLRFANVGSDDIVLDSFAGSGTTAHAVLALNKEDGGNRKFILIECEDYADTITAERVRRVINGVPNASDASLREGLGGSFTYGALGEPMEIERMLTGEALPAYESLAAYLLYTTSGVSVGVNALGQKNDEGLFHSADKIDYYLLYKPDLEYLQSNEAMFNLDRAERIHNVSCQNGGKAIVYAPGKYIGQRELTGMGITFCQLPHALHER